MPSSPTLSPLMFLDIDVAEKKNISSNSATTLWFCEDSTRDYKRILLVFLQYVRFFPCLSVDVFMHIYFVTWAVPKVRKHFQVCLEEIRFCYCYSSLCHVCSCTGLRYLRIKCGTFSNTEEGGCVSPFGQIELITLWGTLRTSLKTMGYNMLIIMVDVGCTNKIKNYCR